MNKNCLLMAASLFLMFSSFGQNIGINADGSRPNPNAILDIKSGTKGLLIPRMDSLARNSIPNTKGLMVYDISTDNFWYNTGKGWQCIPNDNDRGKGGNAWLLAGNANAKDGVNFLGTTNNVPLSIRVNNQPSGRIDSATGSAFWGYRAGSLNSGHDNTATGAFALKSNSTGANNTANGFMALISNTTGNYNTAIGTEALYSLSTGSGLTATGYQSLYSNTTGSSNTAYGQSALFSNSNGSDNTAVGQSALSSNSNGNNNTAVGLWSLSTNVSGGSNTATGCLAMYNNTGGSLNTSTGETAMLLNTTGSNNTSTGYQSMLSNTSGNNNTADGADALYLNTSGHNNAALGDSALLSNTTGNYNSAIGSQADVSTGNLTNATALGAGAIVDASNKVRIGNGAVTVIEGQVPFTTPSDGRYKFNVRENVKGLDFILQLRPVTYQFDVKRFDAQMNHQQVNKNAPQNYALQAGYDEATRIRRSGFIAQEVEQAAQVSGYDFSGIIRPKTEEDHYSLSYDAFVVPLVKAVQEQQQIILLQNKKLEEQDKKLLALQAQLDEIRKLLQPAN